MADEDAVASDQPTAEALPVVFTGKRGFLFRLALKNAILTILTLGIYRFWAKTWLRRFYWNNTRVAGAPLEYLGQPSELFIGFLIALAFLVPLGLIYALGSFLTEASTGWRSVVDILYFAVLLFLIQIAIYRMWRYRLSRTAWRGIRFGLDGVPLRFALRWLGWAIAMIATLGMAYPWMRVSLERYFWSHVRFGQTRFAIDAKGTGLLGPWLTFVGLSIVLPIIPFVAATFYLGDSARELIGLESLESWREFFTQNMGVLVIGLVTLLAALLSVPMMYIWYRVREFRYFARTIQFDGCTFTSTLTARSIIGLGVLTMVTMIFALIPVQAPLVFAGYTLGMSTGVTSIVLFVVTLIVMQVVLAVIFQFGLFTRICATFTLSDSAPFESAVQSAVAGPATGEGFADALDVGGF
jgi:uncharacterized membrane protein YjgN (DUF898 family)